MGGTARRVVVWELPPRGAMSDMIERVAKRLFEEWTDNANQLDPHRYPVAPWAEANQPLFRFLANIAVEEMKKVEDPLLNEAKALLAQNLLWAIRDHEHHHLVEVSEAVDAMIDVKLAMFVELINARAEALPPPPDTKGEG